MRDVVDSVVALMLGLVALGIVTLPFATVAYIAYLVSS
jgi:hypothetical protein